MKRIRMSAGLQSEVEIQREVVHLGPDDDPWRIVLSYVRGASIVVPRDPDAAEHLRGALIDLHQDIDRDLRDGRYPREQRPIMRGICAALGNTGCRVLR